MNPFLRKTTAIIVVICVTILFHLLGLLSPLETRLRRIISPVSEQVYEFSLSVGDQEELFSSVEELEQAYRELKERETQRVLNDAQIEILQDENATLRDQLSFFEKKQFESVGATVVGRGVDPIDSTLIINKGEQDGLAIGNPVIIGSGLFIGKVASVHEATSVVRLINDTQSRVAATVLNTDRSIGLIEGGFGISVQMSFIPQNEQVQIGDTIVTSGLEESMPYGLVIGTVESVEKEVYEPFQRALVRPPEPLDRTRLVSVLTTIDL